MLKLAFGALVLAILGCAFWLVRVDRSSTPKAVAAEEDRRGADDDPPGADDDGLPRP